ncbi:cohesin domain-containing protein [Pseudoalteromonas sp. T1lg23B]|uniref:cohesin domain-containing protein n=1 Tax=Pseudoalteromonas sp. T1lg23B TaxID=2077097 RepID=UPI000CF73290|nr:cohesin domain-containing protein [Pseudoalteromonas sp. T1lg23B]
MKNIVFMLSVMIFSNLSFASDGRVYLFTPSEQVKLGSEFYVDVLVEGLPNVYGVDLSLQYDPKAFQPIDSDDKQSGLQIENGNFFDDSRLYVLRNSIDADLGKVSYIASQMSPAAEVYGNGRIARIKFKSLGEKNEGMLRIIKTEFGKRNGQTLVFDTGLDLNFVFDDGYEVPSQPSRFELSVSLLLVVLCVLCLAIVGVWTFYRRTRRAL